MTPSTRREELRHLSPTLLSSTPKPYPPAVKEIIIWQSRFVTPILTGQVPLYIERSGVLLLLVITGPAFIRESRPSPLQTVAESLTYGCFLLTFFFRKEVTASFVPPRWLFENSGCDFSIEESDFPFLHVHLLFWFFGALGEPYREKLLEGVAL